MTWIESGRRTSTKRVSYNYKDAFKELELSGSEPEREDQDEAEIDEEEPDDFKPPADEEDDPDEFMQDAVENNEGDEDDVAEEEEDEDRPPVKKAKGAQRKVSTTTDVAGSSVPATPARSSKGSTRTTGITGVSCTGTPGIAGARYVALSSKAAGISTPRQRIVSFWREGGQESRLRNLFGPTSEDLRPLFEARKRWLSQETLPSRAEEHLARSPFVTEETRKKETSALRDWYGRFGRAACARNQQTEEMTAAEAEQYLLNAGPETLNLLAGELKNQKIHSLKKGHYMSAATPFGPQNSRQGWVFHLGSRIQDAQWAPNEQGSTQYLAVTVEQKDPASKKYKHLANPKAPAFNKTNSYPASIQIWAFGSKPDGSLDPMKEPRLALVICADWGAPKAIRWWPIGSQESAEQDGTVHLGLLAGIWSDGKVRIIDIAFTATHETQYLHFTQAALSLAFHSPPSHETAKPKDLKLSTVPSCLTWLSPTSLAVATASGNVAIWTLTHPSTFSPNPRPWFHKQLADTYIVTLSSGYPSRPHFLSLTTADGFSRLVDLRSPLADAVCSPRGRMIVYCQAWHEQTQSFVMVDEYYMLKHSTLRRYHQAIYTFRTESTLTTVGTSPVHPAVLVGTSDGSVAVTNGLCRLLHSKDSPWTQMWFQHEWRRGVGKGKGREGEVGTGGETAVGVATATKASGEPLVRILEGYKAVQAGIVATESKRPADGAKFITVFEENSMATRVAWNPNLKFGTWAVAGMQSGMLRVEDLGV